MANTTRKTIVSLNLGSLTNAKHFTFNLFTENAVKQFEYITEHFAREVAAFKKALEYEDKIYMRIDRTFYNQEIGAAEADRTKILRKLRDLAKAYTIDGDANKVSAAEKCLKVIDLYGGTSIQNKPVDAKSGIIANMVSDLKKKFSDEVELLGMTSVVTNLETVNNRYVELRGERTMLDSEDGKGAMGVARNNTDEFYRVLISAVNNASRLGDYEDLAGFISYMNIEIDRYRIGLGQSVGNGSGDVDEEGRLMKTATFRFVGGNVLKLRIEAGTPLEAPQNTEGYRWKPAVPEFMPEKNSTYKEVAIEPEEVTATFHFADHTEIEIRQHAGSALTAPETQPGYHWEPEVPEVMPAEATSYYEMLMPDMEIKPKVFSAQFTFADGTSTKRMVEAGGILEAPQNTPGYSWSPKVPAFMPAANLSFHEVIGDGLGQIE